ncbi:hypothetical protein B0H19DRAFT_1082460 [Mycena capillaripes]|nr:hypothetical protein B0H19DRAFT_1082460 [Mycena capillaripes]
MVNDLLREGCRRHMVDFDDFDHPRFNLAQNFPVEAAQMVRAFERSGSELKLSCEPNLIITSSEPFINRVCDLKPVFIRSAPQILTSPSWQEDKEGLIVNDCYAGAGSNRAQAMPDERNDEELIELPLSQGGVHGLVADVHSIPRMGGFDQDERQTWPATLRVLLESPGNWFWLQYRKKTKLHSTVPNMFAAVARFQVLGTTCNPPRGSRGVPRFFGAKFPWIALQDDQTRGSNQKGTSAIAVGTLHYITHVMRTNSNNVIFMMQIQIHSYNLKLGGATIGAFGPIVDQKHTVFMGSL